MTEFKTVGVLAHPFRPATTPLARQIAEGLEARGLTCWVRTGDAAEALHELTPGTDLVVAIGGDGAMLRAARLCAPFDVPVLGVNEGRLGFLTEIYRPQSWLKALEAVLEGRYWIEERMMIGYEIRRGDAVIGHGDALNDVVIGRGQVPTTAWLETYIDRNWATTYVADGLIIATATGSTAYALAAGGPILPPELRNILVVPVAPHLSMDRPIVVSEGAVIDIFIAAENRTEVVLSADGILAETLQVGDRVTVQAGEHVSRFIRLRSRAYFYRSLLDRLEPRRMTRQRPRHANFEDNNDER
ncbi:MAG: NAD(+)/NADH kinase [Anaerolineae bacterium]